MPAVRFGKVKGILTCAHALAANLGFDEVGILLFPAQSEADQRLRVRQVDLADNVAFANDKESENGPDLAFVRLPDHVLASIGARVSIIDGERQRAQWLAGEPERAAIGSLAFGVLAESTAKKVKRDGTPATTFRAPLILGDIADVGDANGFDVFRLHPRKELNDPPPKESYGGLSRNGVWQMFMNVDGNPAQIRLAGVIFYERLVDDELHPIGHGPRSIYGRLYEAIMERWG